MAEMLLKKRCSQMTGNAKSTTRTFLLDGTCGSGLASRKGRKAAPAISAAKQKNRGCYAAQSRRKAAPTSFAQRLKLAANHGYQVAAITSQIPELIICLQRFVASPTTTRIASP
ncbi:hypothetical protein [Pseudomonas rustica]